MNEVSIIINNIEYIPIDNPLEDGLDYSCEDCDIFKVRPIRSMADFPICFDIENIKVHKSCCTMLRKNIHRIWKIKSQ